MGGVMQSGVTTTQPKPSFSVCLRLRTGPHSSDRKVRPNSVQLLHYPSIHLSIFPPIHPFPWSSFTMSSILWDLCSGNPLSTSPTTCSCAPSFHLHSILTITHISPLSILLSVSGTALLL
ncbi:hypothetical protein Q8A73_009860 [Channa argus]|nr:hypothetical protein Q8A73_009860 [Channa argus]